MKWGRAQHHGEEGTVTPTVTLLAKCAAGRIAKPRPEGDLVGQECSGEPSGPGERRGRRRGTESGDPQPRRSPFPHSDRDGRWPPALSPPCSWIRPSRTRESGRDHHNRHVLVDQRDGTMLISAERISSAER